MTCIRSLEISNNYPWKATKRPSEIKEPLLKDNNILVFTDIEKSVTFGKHLENTFKNHQYVRPKLYKSSSKVSLISFTNVTSYRTHFPGEIISIVKNLSISKVPGYDFIINKVLKNLFEKATLSITVIYNSMWRLSCFPLENCCRNFSSQKPVNPKPGKSKTRLPYTDSY